MTDGKNILLQRRPSTGIWGGLLTLPEGLELLPGFGLSEHKLQNLPPRTHVFTHFRLEIHPRLCRVEQMPLFVNEPGLECLALEEALQAGVPAPVLRLLREVVALTEK